MKKKTKRTFSKEYKAEVVELVRKAGGNAAKIARQVGITSQTVGAWVRQAAIDCGEGRSNQLTSAERIELSALRKENKDLRMEREFLKKTSAWFARELR